MVINRSISFIPSTISLLKILKKTITDTRIVTVKWNVSIYVSAKEKEKKKKKKRNSRKNRRKCIIMIRVKILVSSFTIVKRQIKRYWSIFTRHHGDTAVSCKLDRWSFPLPVSVLSRFIVSTIRIITNPMKKNLKTTLRAHTAIGKYSPCCRKM